MARGIRISFMALVLCVPAAVFAQETKPPALPIKEVALYKHGVAYFVRMGEVTGDAAIPLRFKKQEMSDLLKSLTVIDMGGGQIRTIGYESTKTVDQQLAEYTFNLRAAAGLPAILEQMKGSQVTLQVTDKELTGLLMAVEKRIEGKPEEQKETWYVSVLLDGGVIKSFNLADVQTTRFTDPKLQAELDKYLRTLFSRHRRDQK